VVWERFGGFEVGGAAGRVEDLLGALLERAFELYVQVSILSSGVCREKCPYDRYDIRWLIVQSLRQVLVVCDQVRNVDVAVVLLRQHVLSDLISVYEDVVEVELEDEVDQLLLYLSVRLLPAGRAAIFAEEAECVH